MLLLLPQEVLDIILAFIPSNDLETLKSCSLASSGFAALAQPRILHTISLLPPASVNGADRGCQKFYHLLKTSPRVGDLVKDFRIIDSRAEDEDNPSVRWAPASSHLLSTILPLLGNLKRLTIQGFMLVEWHQFSPDFKQAVKNLAPQLETLYFRGLRVSSWSQLNGVLEIVAVANRLKGLTLSYKLNQLIPGELIIPPAWKPEQLQSLAFTDDWTSGALAPALIASKIDFGRLRVLSISGLQIEPFIALFNVIPRENVVENLHVWCPSGFPSRTLGLASFPRLRKLRLSASFSLSTFEQVVHDCANTPALEQVTFEAASIYAIRYAKRASWATFRDAIRASGEFKVEIIIVETTTAWLRFIPCRETVEDILTSFDTPWRDILTVRDVTALTDLAKFEEAHPCL